MFSLLKGKKVFYLGVLRYIDGYVVVLEEKLCCSKNRLKKYPPWPRLAYLQLRRVPLWAQDARRASSSSSSSSSSSALRSRRSPPLALGSQGHLFAVPQNYEGQVEKIRFDFVAFPPPPLSYEITTSGHTVLRPFSDVFPACHSP